MSNKQSRVEELQVEEMRECRGWCSVATTLLTNLKVSSSLRKFGGGIPASTGKARSDETLGQLY